MKQINLITAANGSEDLEVSLRELISLRREKKRIEQQIESIESDILFGLKLDSDTTPELNFETDNMRLSVTRDRNFSVTADDKNEINKFIQENYSRNWPIVLNYYNIDFKPNAKLKKASYAPPKARMTTFVSSLISLRSKRQNPKSVSNPNFRRRRINAASNPSNISGILRKSS